MWGKESKSIYDAHTITNELTTNSDSYQVDLEYLQKELEALKQSVKVTYIDKRARENDLNEDLLEEVKTAFNEISNKEKSIKQVIQLMEFLLERYSNLSSDYSEKIDKLETLEDDNTYLRDNVVHR